MTENPSFGLTGDQRGQAVTEYILLLFVVMSGFLVIQSGLARFQVAKKLMSPITHEFARAYQYGHPKGKGYDDGGPDYHPRARAGGTNFRMFLNPKGP